MQREAPVSRRPQGGSLQSVWLWLLLLALLRGLFLLAALDPEEERVMNVLDTGGASWEHGPERPLYDREELYTATAGEAIRHHAGIPLGRYRFMPYASGSLLLSILAAGLFSVTGPSYLAFKLIPLGTTLLGGLFWLLFVRTWLGNRAGLLFGVLYLFAPSVLVRTALIAKGDHPEAMALLGGVLFLASTAARYGPGRGRLVWGAAAGLLAGFCVFVTYATVPVLAAAALAGLMLGRGRDRSLHGALLAGGAAGLLPWLFNWVSSGRAALQVYHRPLGTLAPAGEILSRAGLILTRGFLAGYDLPGGGPVRIAASLVLTLAVLVGLVSLIRRWSRPLPLIVLLGLGAHLAAFCLMAPDASSRYLIPGYPLLLIAALAPLLFSGADGERTGQRPPVRSLAVLLAALAGLCAQFWVVGRSDFTALRAPLRGTDWPLLGEVLGQKLKLEEIQRCPVAMRPYLMAGWGKRLFYERDSAGWRDAAGAAGDLEPAVWRGIGLSWAENGGWQAAAPYLRTLTWANREALLQGLAAYSEVLFLPLLGPGGIPAALEAFDPPDREVLRLGLARTLGVLAVHAPGAAPARVREAAGLLEPEEGLYGAGWALFRADGRSAGFRTWEVPPGAWLKAPGKDVEDPAETGYWSGAAQAYAWHLGKRTPGWLLGSSEGPVSLARTTEIVVKGRPDSQAELFYWTAAETAAEALQEPFVFSGRDPSAWPWRTTVPPRFHPRFLDGLRQGGLKI